MTIATFFFWGVGTFFGKLSADRVGSRSVFWDLMGYTPAVFIYCLLAFKVRDITSSNMGGAVWGILAGVLGSFGLIGFYVLLSKEDSSLVVPLTALYPALSIGLAIISLKEAITVEKVIGILLSIVAIYLLSKS